MNVIFVVCTIPVPGCCCRCWLKTACWRKLVFVPPLGNPRGWLKTSTTQKKRLNKAELTKRGSNSFFMFVSIRLSVWRSEKGEANLTCSADRLNWRTEQLIGSSRVEFPPEQNSGSFKLQIKWRRQCSCIFPGIPNVRQCSSCIFSGIPNFSCQKYPAPRQIFRITVHLFEVK